MLKSKTKKKSKGSKLAKPLKIANEAKKSKSDADSTSNKNIKINSTSNVESILSKEATKSGTSNVESISAIEVTKSITPDLESIASNISATDEKNLRQKTSERDNFTLSMEDLKAAQEETHTIQRMSRQRVSFFDKLGKLPSISTIQLTSDDDEEEEEGKLAKLRRKSKKKRKSQESYKIDNGKFVDPLTGEASNTEQLTEINEYSGTEDEDLLVEFEDFKDANAITSTASDFFRN